MIFSRPRQLQLRMDHLHVDRRFGLPCYVPCGPCVGQGTELVARGAFEPVRASHRKKLMVVEKAKQEAEVKGVAVLAIQEKG